VRKFEIGTYAVLAFLEDAVWWSNPVLKIPGEHDHSISPGCSDCLFVYMYVPFRHQFSGITPSMKHIRDTYMDKMFFPANTIKTLLLIWVYQQSGGVASLKLSGFERSTLFHCAALVFINLPWHITLLCYGQTSLSQPLLALRLRSHSARSSSSLPLNSASSSSSSSSSRVCWGPFAVTEIETSPALTKSPAFRLAYSCF